MTWSRSSRSRGRYRESDRPGGADSWGVGSAFPFSLRREQSATATEKVTRRIVTATPRAVAPKTVRRRARRSPEATRKGVRPPCGGAACRETPASGGPRRRGSSQRPSRGDVSLRNSSTAPLSAMPRCSSGTGSCRAGRARRSPRDSRRERFCDSPRMPSPPSDVAIESYLRTPLGMSARGQSHVGVA